MKKIATLVILVFLFFSGYAQLKKFTVEVPYPPKLELPESIQSFTLLNRCITPEFEDYNEQKLQVEFYKKNFTVNSILLDSVAADSALITLGDFLFDSQRFDVVIPLNRSIYRSKSYRKTLEPLDWQFVEDVCNTYNTDALVVLENMAIRVVADYNKSYYNWGDYHYASMDYYTRAHWRIYNPLTKKIQVDFLMSQDTIFWDNASENIVDLFNGLPSVKTATIMAGIKLAQNFSEKITPKWVSTTRYYYVIKNSEIDESVKMAADGDWNGALNNWMEYEDYGNNSTKSKIMLNIALANEMNGDVEKAIEWIKLSIETQYREVANHYLKELLKRKALSKK